MSEIPFVLYHSGTIPGVRGPNGDGTWPGGITVYVDEDTNEVLSISPFAPSGVQPVESSSETPAVPEIPVQPDDEQSSDIHSDEV